MQACDELLARLDATEFAHQISAWFDPHVLADCAIRYERDPAVATQRTSVFLGLDQLSPNSPGALELITTFLHNVRIPKATIEFVAARTLRSHAVSKATWTWFHDLAFAGEVLPIMEAEYEDETLSGFIVKERDVVLDLLVQPLKALVDLIGLYTDNWNSVIQHQPTQDVFLRHCSGGPVFVYIESHIAEALTGRPIADAGIIAEYSGCVTRYRAATVVGKLPPDSADIDVARDVMRHMAAETRKPI